MTFEDVVKQLQMNNRSEAGRDGRQTKMLGDLKTAIEGLTVATESTDEPAAAAEEEKDKDERSRAKKLLDAVGGLKDSIGSAFKDVGAIKTGVPGLTLGLLAKLAVIPLLIKFLQSDLWLKIKDALLDPNVSALGMLFGDFKVEMTLLTALVGAFAIGKIVDLARKLVSGFSGIAASLTTLGAVVGIGTAVSAGTLAFIIGGIVLVAKSLFEAFKTFKEKFAETGSVIESLKASIIDFVANLLFFPLELIKDITAFIADKLGFDNIADKLRSFDIVEIMNNFITNGVNTIQAGFTAAITAISEFPEKVRNFFAEVDIFGGIRETLANTDIFGPVRTFLAELPDRIQELMPDVGAIFEDAKQKVLDAVDRVKASIPTPDFSIIGQKITDLANFFSPTRILTSIGDSINERFQPDGLVGRLTKKAIMKIFPTSPVEVDEPTIGGGITPMQSGGFLGANSFALVGEQGPELIMSKAPMQVFSEQRTDQIGMAALNKLMGGGDGGGGGGTMFLNTGSNVQNVNKQTIVTPIVDQDPVIRQVSRSIMA
tara:strand:- start:74 stop:1702 length:1629 start_codon:yes stop_codon:yes gene_type:complete